MNQNSLLVTGGVIAGTYAVYKLLTRPQTTQTTTENNPIDERINTVQNRAKNAVKITREWREAVFPLTKGMKGDVVGELQVILSKLGAKVSADGKFGSETESALQALNLPLVISLDKFKDLKTKRVQVEQPNDSPYNKLLKMGYNQKTEIDVAIQVKKELNSFLVNDNNIKKLLEKPNKTLTNIQRAYNSLYGSLRNDLLALKLGSARFNTQLAKLQALR